MNILERIEKGFVIFDGGMGTMIQPHMKLGELPEMLNITMPDVIYGVHKAYLDAATGRDERFAQWLTPIYE